MEHPGHFVSHQGLAKFGVVFSYKRVIQFFFPNSCGKKMNWIFGVLLISYPFIPVSSLLATRPLMFKDQNSQKRIMTIILLFFLIFAFRLCFVEATTFPKQCKTRCGTRCEQSSHYTNVFSAIF